MSTRERELPLLGAIAGVLRWLEELANIIAGPLLTAGLAIALIDLLTDGRLLTSQPELLYAWAVSQAVGVDMQLVASWDRARQALRARRWATLVGLLVLGVALAAVGYLAAVIFAMQQSAGISTSEALARLGMDSATWLVSRAALSVVLVCLSGWTRYHPPAKVAPSLDEERAQIERELTLEPLRAELRTRKALGWRDVGRSIIAGAAASASESHPTHAQAPSHASDSAEAFSQTPDMDFGLSAMPSTSPSEPPTRPPTRPPTGPGSPAVQRRPKKRRVQTPRGGKRPAVLRLTPEGEYDAERRIRAVLGETPRASIKSIAERAYVSSATASKWARVLREEQRAQSHQQQSSQRGEAAAAQ